MSARIKIELPERLPFITTIEVRITDLNYGNHLGNDSLLSILHEARCRYLSSLGYSEKDLEGTGIIMADVGIEYKSEAGYGEHLQVEVGVAGFTRVAFDMFYRVTSAGRLVAIAKTGIVCYDYALRKVVKVPEKFISAVSP
jgi:acyl-CoA thioesterase FadM